MTLDRLTLSTPRGALPYLHAGPHGRASRAPVVLFLHGGRDCGDDLDLLQRSAPVRHAAAMEQRPFHFVAPQLRADAAWTDHPDDLLALIDLVVATTDADPSRVVIAGFSLGGTAAWQIAAANPGRFAGLVAISARIPSGLVLPALADTPARVFHGGCDHKIPPADIDAHVTALREVGGAVHYTLFTQGNHFIDEQAFVEGGIDRWVMELPAIAAHDDAVAPLVRQRRDTTGETALA